MQEKQGHPGAPKQDIYRTLKESAAARVGVPDTENTATRSYTMRLKMPSGTKGPPSCVGPQEGSAARPLGITNRPFPI